MPLTVCVRLPGCLPPPPAEEELLELATAFMEVRVDVQIGG